MRVPLSVIMTVLNGEPYLKEALRGLLQQTCQDFELIVVNNGSTDNSLQVLESIDDPRLRIISLGETLGRTDVLNLVLEAAQGDCVAVQDADDISLPQRLEKQMAYMEAHQDVVLLGTWFEFISENGKHLQFFKPPTDHDEIVRANVDYNTFGHPTVMFRRQPVVEVGGYPSKYVYSQDWALWLRLMRLYKVAILPDIMVKIRVHPEQMTLSPEYALTRSRESLQHLKFAALHPDVMGLPKSPSLGKAMFDYARSLSKAGRYPSAWLWLAKFCVQSSDLWRSDKSLRRSMIDVLLGQWGTHAAWRVKHLIRRGFMSLTR